MADSPYISVYKKCDIVMKAESRPASSIHRAVTRLAKEYSFQSIANVSRRDCGSYHGRSRYRRRQGTDVFAEMDKIPDWLGAPSESANAQSLQLISTAKVDGWPVSVAVRS